MERGDGVQSDQLKINRDGESTKKHKTVFRSLGCMRVSTAIFCMHGKRYCFTNIAGGWSSSITKFSGFVDRTRQT